MNKFFPSKKVVISSFILDESRIHSQNYAKGH